MMTESFYTIRNVVEVPAGLQIEHHAGQASLLRRDHERFAWIAELVRRAMRLSANWPVRLFRAEDGLIVNAQVAWGGRVFAVDEEANGDCTAYFLLMNTPRILKRQHPQFERLLDTLMFSAGEKRDVWFCEVPGEANVLADVCLVPELVEVAR